MLNTVPGPGLVLSGQRTELLNDYGNIRTPRFRLSHSLRTAVSFFSPVRPTWRYGAPANVAPDNYYLRARAAILVSTTII